MQIDLPQAKQLLLLLKSNYPLMDSLLLINSKYQQYAKEMEKGVSFHELIITYKSNDFMSHLFFFLNIVPLEKAIEKSIVMCEFAYTFKQKLIKQLSYPLLIVFIAFMLLLFFLFYIFPMLMDTFPLTDTTLLTVLHLLKMVTFILIVLFSLFILYGIMMFLSKRIRYLTMIYLSRVFQIIPIYCSYYFAHYLKEFMDLHIPTILMFDYLKLSHYDWLKQIAIHFDEQLSMGKNYLDLINDEPLFHPLFKQTMNLIVHTSKSSLIDTFLIQVDLYLERFYKRMNIYIQLFTYSFVGIIVLLVFQVFMIPLSMLETF